MLEFSGYFPSSLCSFLSISLLVWIKVSRPLKPAFLVQLSTIAMHQKRKKIFFSCGEEIFYAFTWGKAERSQNGESCCCCHGDGGCGSGGGDYFKVMTWKLDLRSRSTRPYPFGFISHPYLPPINFFGVGCVEINQDLSLLVQISLRGGIRHTESPENYMLCCMMKEAIFSVGII